MQKRKGGRRSTADLRGARRRCRRRRRRHRSYRKQATLRLCGPVSSVTPLHSTPLQVNLYWRGREGEKTPRRKREESRCSLSPPLSSRLQQKTTAGSPLICIHAFQIKPVASLCPAPLHSPALAIQNGSGSGNICPKTEYPFAGRIS